MPGQRTSSSNDTSSTPFVAVDSAFAIPSTGGDEKIRRDEKLVAQTFIFDSEKKRWGPPTEMTCEPTRKQICLDSSSLDTDVMQSVSDIEPSLEIIFSQGGCVKIWRDVISKKSLELTEEEMLTNVAFRRCEFQFYLTLVRMDKQRISPQLSSLFTRGRQNPGRLGASSPLLVSFQSYGGRQHCATRLQLRETCTQSVTPQ
eukprot:scaffold1071_cov166-Amphora_coffeaeformis.AAC.14